MAGVRTLADCPNAIVSVACRKSDRRGQYRRSNLITLCGEKAVLPGALGQLAHDCPKRHAIGNDTCGAYFPDFTQDCAAKRVKRRTRQWT